MAVMRPLGAALVVATLIAIASPATAAPPHALWVRQFGTPDEDFAGDVDTDNSGDVAVLACQHCYSPTEGRLVVRRYDSSGALVWKRAVAGDPDHHGYRLAMDKQRGDIYVVGYVYRSGPPSYGPVGFVAKLDRAGNRQWEHQFGTTLVDVAVRDDGTVFAVGGTAGGDAKVVAFSPTGAKEAVLALGTPGNDYATDIGFDTSGNAYVAGTTTGTFPGERGSGASDVFLAKLDGFGSRVWIHQFASGVVDDNIQPSLAVYGSGYAFVGGEMEGANGDAYVRAFDPSGASLWQRKLASPETDIAYDLDVDGAGNVYLGGYTFGALADSNAAVGSLHALVATYNPSGGLVAISQFETPDGVAGVLGIALGPVSTQPQPLYVAGGATGAFSGQTSSGRADNFVLRLR
jgi:hypothetical protein